ncbi:MAG: hypothetical protein V1944_02120 [Candidatus Aenigmatarchaeota archaeon]
MEVVDDEEELGTKNEAGDVEELVDEDVVGWVTVKDAEATIILEYPSTDGVRTLTLKVSVQD